MNYKELISLKKEICLDYINHYKEKGFNEVQPLPLDYKNDITLDFTTCTVCSAKENIRKNKKGEDYVMIQPALRNTHMDVLGQTKGDDYFFSFFSMMGGFKYSDNKISAIENYNEILKSEFNFLKKYGEEIILTIPVQYISFLKIKDSTLEYLKSKKCIIQYSENDEKNLKWKYGIKDVIGYGIRWEINNKLNIINWGNTINVYKNGENIGVDFGGGVESLIYAFKGLKNSIYANDSMTDMTKSICQSSSLHEKMMDCLVSAMCIIANKENIILRDKIVLDKYMSLLYSFMILNDISTKKVLTIVKDINSKNIRFLSKENMLEIFSDYLAITIHNHSILSNSENIDKVLNLLNICYNDSDELWAKNKRIITSHYSKYFLNLSETELLALKNSKKNRVKKKEKKL